jgi:hypothetical protein
MCEYNNYVLYFAIEMVKIWLKCDNRRLVSPCEISSSHGGEYDVQNCLLGCTRQYIPEDSSEHHC